MSQLIFPSERLGNKAIQVVQVVARSGASSRQLRPFTFTFCLERIDVGPYKVLAPAITMTRRVCPAPEYLYRPGTVSREKS